MILEWGEWVDASKIHNTSPQWICQVGMVTVVKRHWGRKLKVNRMHNTWFCCLEGWWLQFPWIWTKKQREFTGDAGVIVFAIGFIAAALRWKLEAARRNSWSSLFQLPVGDTSRSHSHCRVHVLQTRWLQAAVSRGDIVRHFLHMKMDQGNCQMFSMSYSIHRP